MLLSQDTGVLQYYKVPGNWENVVVTAGARHKQNLVMTIL